MGNAAAPKITTRSFVFQHADSGKCQKPKSQTCLRTAGYHQESRQRRAGQFPVPIRTLGISRDEDDRVGKLLREAEAAHRNTRHQSRLVLRRARKTGQQTFSARPSGTGVAGRPTGCCQATILPRPKPGRRAGPRVRLSPPPICKDCWRTRACRSARRTGAGHVRHDVLIDRIRQGRQTSRAGSDHRDALAGTAGRPDCERIRAGLRGEFLDGCRRAEKHAGRDCWQAQQRDQCGARGPQDEGAARRPGR